MNAFLWWFDVLLNHILTRRCQLGLADSSVQLLAAAGRREAMWALLTCHSQHNGDAVLCPGHL